MSSSPRFRGLRVRPNHPRSSRKDPPEEVVQNCNREVDEVLRYASSPTRLPVMRSAGSTPPPYLYLYCDSRVLRKGGVFIYLTFGQPHFRRRYLDRPGTTLEIRKLGEAFHYYLYIVRS